MYSDPWKFRSHISTQFSFTAQNYCGLRIFNISSFFQFFLQYFDFMGKKNLYPLS
jgi:hypothetical protein